MLMLWKRSSAYGGAGVLANTAFRGFLVNGKRGTAYTFTNKAVAQFLTYQGLSHIIRPHKVIPNRYRYQMSGKEMTIFSFSRDCDTDNEVAAIFVKDDKIRVIRIDT